MREAPYQLLPPLTPDELEALRADVRERGILVPVEFDEETGEVLDGHHRLQVAAELGIECPRVTRRFASDEERIAHILSLNLVRRHLGPEQRRALVAQLRERGWSIPRIAESVKASVGTVHADLQGFSPERLPGAVVGSDGKIYPATITRQRLDEDEWPEEGDAFPDDGPAREVEDEEPFPPFDDLPDAPSAMSSAQQVFGQ